MKQLKDRKDHKVKQLKRQNGLTSLQKAGYSFLAVYSVSALALLVACVKVDILPAGYVGIAALVLTAPGVLFGFMHRKLLMSITADILCVLLTAVSVTGCFYLEKLDSTIAGISGTGMETEAVSVYVLAEDPAQTLADAADYLFGVTLSADRQQDGGSVSNEAVQNKAIRDLEKALEKDLEIREYDSMFRMLDDLKDNAVGAVVISSSCAGLAADAEGYEWTAAGLRELTTVSFEVEDQTVQAVPEDVPETFLMYLSGIDTYGGVLTRSRSDVNILAAVNTKAKEILLLSTPRDSYVDFEASGGAKDKLTHAGIYGVEQSVDALERLYDIDIDYYLRVNFTGFVDIIDALGGITVYSEYDFSVQNIKDYHKGYNRLTGLEALAFARERYSFERGDYQRAENQMEVIRAVISKAATSSLLMNYGSVMDAVAGSFETNMPREQISDLVKMQLSDMASWNVTSYTTAGQSRYAQTYSMPGRQLYVIVPDEDNVAEAKRLIAQVYGAGEAKEEGVQARQ